MQGAHLQGQAIPMAQGQTLGSRTLWLLCHVPHLSELVSPQPGEPLGDTWESCRVLEA